MMPACNSPDAGCCSGTRPSSPALPSDSRRCGMAGECPASRQVGEGTRREETPRVAGRPTKLPEASRRPRQEQGRGQGLRRGLRRSEGQPSSTAKSTARQAGGPGRPDGQRKPLLTNGGGGGGALPAGRSCPKHQPRSSFLFVGGLAARLSPGGELARCRTRYVFLRGEDLGKRKNTHGKEKHQIEGSPSR